MSDMQDALTQITAYEKAVAFRNAAAFSDISGIFDDYAVSVTVYKY